MRLSIELTTEQHQILKAAAAMQGESIKDYVLKRTLPDFEEQKALEILESELKSRVEAVKKGQISKKTVNEIFTQVLNSSD